MGIYFKKKEVKIINTYFFCILLSLLPVLITTLVSSTFSSGNLYPLSIGVIFLIQVIISIYCYSKFKGKKINKKLISLAIILTTSQAITLLISLFNGLEIDGFDFINVFVRAITFFVFIVIPYKFKISRKALEKFMFYIVTLGCIACLYNIIINFNGLRHILNINNPYAVNFKSFFIGRNSFGQLLLFSMIANTFLFFIKKSAYSKFCYLLFVINIVATLSRTVTGSVSIFLIIFFLIHFRKKLKSKFLIICFVSVFLFLIFSNDAVSNFIIKMLIRSETGTTGRSVFWGIAIQVLNENNWLFGIGYLTSRSLLKSMGYSSQFHNFYLETLVGGGVIELILHVIIFKLTIENLKMIIKNDKVIGNIYFSGFIALLFYSFFESVSYFSMGYVDSIFRMFFLTIPILYSNNFRRNKCN
ncbi:O-antigen ligase family protein [Psychrilyobacter atlanticus]|uniref:O-antigen ligase family protein n=1 Tax=Psychrilyobacter atlanticus TaxID=271091 RepID=UPI000415EF9A|nr:O-antigen ligase family protein [Psychrilyobacter atlanticus]